MPERSVAWTSLSIPLLLVAQLATADAGWQQVHAPSSFIDRNGELRQTGCSNAPGSAAADFSFFYREGNPRRLVIGFDTGASAGGYGAYFAYPEIHGLLSAATRKLLFSDSAVGIVNQDFYERALAPGGAWGIWNNMPAELAGAFAAGPDRLPIAINQALGDHFPETRFGQYTRAFDSVQIFYLNIARNPDAPQLWTDPRQLFLTSLVWTTRARASLEESALTTSNYRYYLGAGFDHTVIADEDVYLEDSADGLTLIDWLDDMIERGSAFGGDWQSASCFPNCLP